MHITGINADAIAAFMLAIAEVILIIREPNAPLSIFIKLLERYRPFSPVGSIQFTGLL